MNNFRNKSIWVKARATTAARAGGVGEGPHRTGKRTKHIFVVAHFKNISSFGYLVGHKQLNKLGMGIFPNLQHYERMRPIIGE